MISKGQICIKSCLTFFNHIEYKLQTIKRFKDKNYWS